jgi:hypothetical protein
MENKEHWATEVIRIKKSQRVYLESLITTQEYFHVAIQKVIDAHKKLNQGK